MRPFKGLMMTKFEHIRNVAGEYIVSRFTDTIGGVPSIVWIMEHNGNEFMVATPKDASDPEVLIVSTGESKVTLHGHYEGVFECSCTIEAIFNKIASGECDCPECAKEKQAATIH